MQPDAENNAYPYDEARECPPSGLDGVTAVSLSFIVMKALPVDSHIILHQTGVLDVSLVEDRAHRISSIGDLEIKTSDQVLGVPEHAHIQGKADIAWTGGRNSRFLSGRAAKPWGKLPGKDAEAI